MTSNGKYVGFSIPGGLITSGGRAGNFLHLSLIFVTVVFVGLFNRKSEVITFTLILVAAFLLFSYLLKTHSHTSRLQFAMFVLWTPLISVALFNFRNKDWFIIFPILMWAASLPWVFNNTARPLLPEQRALIHEDWYGVYGRVLQYYELRREALTDFANIVIENGCTDIGFATDRPTWTLYEYPLWMILRSKGFEGRIEHILVQNESAILEDDQFNPCAVIYEQVKKYKFFYWRYSPRGF